MYSKTCTKCLIVKSIDKFKTQKRGIYGKSSQCKDCINKLHNEWRKNRIKNEPEYAELLKTKSYEWQKKNPKARSLIAVNRNKKELSKWPEKVSARALVNQRVRFGRMPRASSLNCEHCKGQACHYHHHKGYAFENRYDVIPVCTKCHKLLG